MPKKPPNVSVFHRKPSRKQATSFNAALLEQRRDETFVALYQVGLLR